jgi:hypothetical protein
MQDAYAPIQECYLPLTEPTQLLTEDEEASLTTLMFQKANQYDADAITGTLYGLAIVNNDFMLVGYTLTNEGLESKYMDAYAMSLDGKSLYVLGEDGLFDLITPSGDENDDFLLSQLEMNEYDNYVTDTVSPTIDEVKAYLENVILYHGAEVVGGAELWALDRGESTQEIRHTQLVAYPVKADGKELLWGADRNTGIVYGWSKGARAEQPEILDSPEIFPTALSALEYARNYLWNPDNFSVEFTLELIPENPETGQYPYYQSQTITFNDVQTATYIIDIDSVDEHSYMIHLYEVVMDSPEEGHTATTGWYRVYKNGFVVDDLLNGRWIAAEAT